MLIKELTIFFTALVFYTRLPCYRLCNFTPEYISKATRYFPLVGWIIGGIAALVYMGASTVFNHSTAIFLSMLSTILATGAFHEDGFADSCDGFGGGSCKESILRIMKDSRIGTYGVIGLISILGVKYLTLLEINTAIIPFVLIAGHSISRLTAITFTYTQDYVRETDSKAKDVEVKDKKELLDIVLITIFGIAPVLLLGYSYLLAIIPILIVRQFIAHYYKNKIGGYTGDALGAAQQITEIVFYISVLVIWKYI